MNHLLYDLATTVAAPLGDTWLRLSAKHRPLRARFAPPVPPGLAQPVWIHACSVGELGVARALVAAIRQRWPGLPVLITVSTVTGYELAGRLFPDIPFTWFPFDARRSVRHFFDGASPRMLILIETELWPNVLREAARRNVPVALVNGRISDRHLPRFRRMGSLGREMFARLSLAAVQSQTYGARLASLGTPQEVIHVTGNLKFDGVATEVDPATLAHLRTACAIRDDESVLLFGSTRPGDEELACTCWTKLMTAFPKLRLVIAPRHIQRAREVVRLFNEQPVARRTSDTPPEGARILLVDTLGELVPFYALATVAVVGGSFFPGVNGHNPIEPAALGIAPLFGPYMANFQDAADTLVAAEGAVQVKATDDLPAMIERLLRDPEWRKRLGSRAREAVLSQRGATEKTISLLQPHLD